MNLEFRDLWWAVVASQHRSIRQAAITLGIPQSTLSRCFRDLEYNLGVALFERSNGGTRPTLAGLEFLHAARQIIDEVDAVVSRLKTRFRGESGRLMVGVHASLSAGNIRATLLEFRRRFPDVEVCLVDGSSDHLISDLVASAIDIAFVAEGSPAWNDKSLSVWSERVIVALHKNHPLTCYDTVHWTDLRNETLLLPMRGPGPEFLHLLVRKIGCPDPRRLLSHDVSLDRFLTLVGAGWGLLLALEGATGAVYPDVVFRGVRDDEGDARLGFHAHWRQTNSNPSLRSFIGILRERYPDLTADPPVAG